MRWGGHPPRRHSLEEWPDLFGAPLLASAGPDQLTHKVHVVVITGVSFRTHRSHRPEEEVHIEGMGAGQVGQKSHK